MSCRYVIVFSSFAVAPRPLRLGRDGGQTWSGQYTISQSGIADRIPATFGPNAARTQARATSQEVTTVKRTRSHRSSLTTARYRAITTVHSSSFRKLNWNRRRSGRWSFMPSSPTWRRGCGEMRYPPIVPGWGGQLSPGRPPQTAISQDRGQDLGRIGAEPLPACLAGESA